MTIRVISDAAADKQTKLDCTARTFVAQSSFICFSAAAAYITPKSHSGGL